MNPESALQVVGTSMASLTIVPQGTLDLAVGHQAANPLSMLPQPVTDVRSYLESRKPVMYWEEEEPLFNKVPKILRTEVKALQSAAEIVSKMVAKKLKVEPACRAVVVSFHAWHWDLVTFRAKYDKWIKAKDWMVFLNRAKAGAEWQAKRESLPMEFLFYCAQRIGSYKREDTRKEALRSIKRQWISGRTMEGRVELIPGYGFAKDWWRKHEAPVGSFPSGWHYTNIMRQINARDILPKASAKMLLQGTSAAREFLPDVITSRKVLGFMGEVSFDDVKTDWRIFDPKTGQAYDLWLLVAHDRATGLLLGFGMRPARVREDGTQEHLKLQDMKQLCGWILERYGLPPYLMVWVIENGTATLSEGSARALEEMMPGRIKIRFTSMIGGKSTAGYAERRTGNATGKASLESHNRISHIIGAALPGQTGPLYSKRPSDLAAREKECRETAELSHYLPEHLRGELGYSLLTLEQAREYLFKIFRIRNSRDDHSMEGFETILEWYDERSEKWCPQNTAPVGVVIRRRKETPIERAAKLMRGLEWKHLSPDIITAFYEHTQRPVSVNDAGEIEFQHEGRKLIFVRPEAAEKLRGGLKLLGYFHPDDPAFLHLTDGGGVIMGTWLQRSLATDQNAISQALAYQARAARDAKAVADALGAPERERLEAMRAHNAELAKDFVEVTPAGPSGRRVLRSKVAKGLASIAEAREEHRDERRQDAAKAADAILSTTGSNATTQTDLSDGDALLAALTGQK